MMGTTLKGTNGRLILNKEFLLIERKGILARLTHLKNKETIIPYSTIESIIFHRGFLFISGYFCFSQTEDQKQCSLLQAAVNENCLVFRSYNNKKASILYEQLIKSVISKK